MLNTGIFYFMAIRKGIITPQQIATHKTLSTIMALIVKPCFHMVVLQLQQHAPRQDLPVKVNILKVRNRLQYVVVTICEKGVIQNF
jgi:hypothetical protein